MKVQVLNEMGYKEALYGLGLSHGLTSDIHPDDFIATETFQRMEKVACKLAFKDGGHGKFLESIVVWLDVLAPRYVWQELDTYRVGTTKQSESTMHTIMKRELTYNNFENLESQALLNYLNHHIREKNFMNVKEHLPEGFLQRRIVCTNYKVLRNIILQRRKHKLKLWQDFIAAIRTQVQHPELLPEI